MNGIFNYDNKFFSVVNKMVDGIYVSILWLLFSIPVITFGASTTALYYTVHKSLRGNRGYVWRCFWTSFKSNFKQTTKIWLVLLALFLVLLVDQQILMTFMQQGRSFGALYYCIYFFLFFWAVYCVYVFAYSARFENGMKETMKNAGYIAILHLPWSLLVLLLLVVASIVMYVSPISILFMPAATTCVMELFLEKKIFRKYMSAEDLQKEQELDYIR